MAKKPYEPPESRVGRVLTDMRMRSKEHDEIIAATGVTRAYLDEWCRETYISGVDFTRRALTWPSRAAAGLCLACGNKLEHPENGPTCCPECGEQVETWKKDGFKVQTGATEMGLDGLKTLDPDTVPKRWWLGLTVHKNRPRGISKERMEKNEKIL